MSFKATLSGFFNRLTGLAVRLAVAVVAAGACWFLIAWGVDVVLNFLAHGTYEGTQQYSFTSEAPLVKAINGLICLVVFILIAKPRRS